MAYRLYVARHGQTDWNAAGLYQGRLESKLTELGERQAGALADYFAALAESDGRAPGAVLSSPLGRCRATAVPAAAALATPLETDDRLIEIAHGDWEGRQRDEIARNDAELWRIWRERPSQAVFRGGESLQDVLERWRAFAARPLDCDTLVVTHDAVARVALLDAARRPLDELWEVPFENAAFAILEQSDAGWKIIDPLCVKHLEGLRVSTAGQAL